jgi:uncharacterized protein DUF4440
MTMRATMAGVILVFILTSGVATGQARVTPAALTAVIAERVEANRSGDLGMIRRIMTPDYFQTDIYGVVQNRDVWLAQYFAPLSALIHEGKFRWTTFDQHIDEIRVLGDCAIVAGSLNLVGVGARSEPGSHAWIADADAQMSGTMHFTQIYVYRRGHWLLAALHNAVPLQQRG